MFFDDLFDDEHRLYIQLRCLKRRLVFPRSTNVWHEDLGIGKQDNGAGVILGMRYTNEHGIDVAIDGGIGVLVCIIEPRAVGWGI